MSHRSYPGEGRHGTPQPAITTLNRGVGKFTTQNIVAVLPAVPESNGTYADVGRVAAEKYGGDVVDHTISNWVATARRDVAAGRRETAYARFAERYRELRDEYSSPERQRTRELDAALAFLDSCCDCGEPKMTHENGYRGETCLVCYRIDQAAFSANGVRRVLPPTAKSNIARAMPAVRRPAVHQVWCADLPALRARLSGGNP